MIRELLLGAGNRKIKELITEEIGKDWHILDTVDIDTTTNPTFVFDLNEYEWSFAKPGTYDEIHAYEILEHLGIQGDIHSFFSTFKNIWDLLKPQGCLLASTPTWDSVWAWGDPGHTRIINEGTLSFLDQDVYVEGVGKSPMSDYRWLWTEPYSFKVVYAKKHEGRFYFVLQKVVWTPRMDSLTTTSLVPTTETSVS